MAKTRLNADKRAVLTKLAAELVDMSVEEAAAEQALGVFQDAMRSHLLAKYPPEDMEVLGRYQLAVTHTSLAIQARMAHHQERMTVELNPPLDLPRNTSCRPEPTEPLWVLAQETKKIVDRVATVRREREAPYRTLIKTSRYYEDVVEVWEEAGQASFKMKLQLPAAVTPSMVRQIKQDMARRARA